MDRWEEAEPYDGYMGRWSRPVAAEFLEWLSCPRDGRWLDVGCGTGALLGTVLDRAGPAHVAGVDPSAEFLAAARTRLGEAAELRVGEAAALPFDSGEFDVVVSGLVLNFVPVPEQAMAEMRRVVVPGGTIAAYVWDYSGGIEFLRYFWDAAVALDPTAASLDEGTRFPLCRPGPLRGLFEDAGLQRVTTGGVEVATVFRDFDDYWMPFLEGQGPAPGYVASLREDHRTRLRDLLRGRLPATASGTIELAAKAWAVSGAS